MLPVQLCLLGRADQRGHGASGGVRGVAAVAAGRERQRNAASPATLRACTTTLTHRSSRTSRRGSIRSATLFNYDSRRQRLADLEAKMGATDFWDKPDAAKGIVSEMKQLKAQTEPLASLITGFEDAKVAYDMAKEVGDGDLLREADEALFGLSRQMEKVEMLSLLAEKHDHRNCFLTISAGDGGTEANDWCEMLFRMYLLFLEKSHPEWKIEEIEKSYGTEVGLDSVTLRVSGSSAFGYLKCERGTHRLARVSPFNAQGKRQTSFASVEVTPEFEESTVEIPDKDLEITPFVRASGPGGQNVNKVASAIRVVHKPTGIMVVSSTYRDQPQNKKQCLSILQAKLEQIEEERRNAEINAAKGGALDKGWGTQIRSYVLYDNRVKDHRTGVEGNPDSVLNGALDEFIDSELKRRRKEKAEAESKVS
ncbi:MAG: peptide chain release factor 2 [Planctomycetota bacterium]|nr:peptide chain release factor 2 [Planctomycetota bacterium]